MLSDSGKATATPKREDPPKFHCGRHLRAPGGGRDVVSQALARFMLLRGVAAIGSIPRIQSGVALPSNSLGWVKDMASNHRRPSPGGVLSPTLSEIGIVIGIKQRAHDQIIRHIEKHFRGHALAHLVGAVLKADGFQTEIAGPGPDGGVDILASRGPLRFDGPLICVQVKSSKHPEDVDTLRALRGAISNFNAQHGLLVAWSGFTRAVVREARQCYFQIRLWDAKDLVEEIYRTYDRLPEEIRLILRLERVWILMDSEE